MTRDYFFYKVTSELRFTEKEVDALIRCSERHYDYKCRQLSKHGGMLYGMKNEFLAHPNLDPPPETATRNFSMDDLDTICKVLENCNDEEEVILCEQFLTLFSEAREESGKMNAHCRP